MPRDDLHMHALTSPEGAPGIGTHVVAVLACKDAKTLAECPGDVVKHAFSEFGALDRRKND